MFDLLLIALSGCHPEPEPVDPLVAPYRDSTAYPDTADTGGTWWHGEEDTAIPDTGPWPNPVHLDLEAEAGAKIVGAYQRGMHFFEATSAGDLDGDGCDDIVLGCAGCGDVDSASSYATGGAFVVAGPPQGGSVEAIAIPLESSEFQAAGSSVSGAGDVNADGIDDLLIGASGYSTEDFYPGRVLLLLGPIDHSMDLAGADASIVGDWDDSIYWSGSSTGSDVEGAGDVDGDGFDDILISAGYYGALGAAYLLSGPIAGDLQLPQDATLTIFPAGESNHVATAGDVNGDGLDDILSGAARYTSCARIFNGPAEGYVKGSDADTVFTCSVDGEGAAQRSAGDVDGDGYDDIIVGASGYGTDEEPDFGAAMIHHGPLPATRTNLNAETLLFGEHAYELAGVSVDGAGDVDGDGLDDVLIGAPWGHYGGDPIPGRAYLVLSPGYGTRPLSQADFIFDGSDDDQVGDLVSGGGDYDGDGRPDLLIGSEEDDEGGEAAGAAWVVYAAQLWP